ncbi:MAG: MiaB/RimO family radical SAM methylthiotransferase, partial [Methanobacterium sp.]
NLKSYPVELVKQEAERAVREGCVEVQLTAQDTAAYGKDSGTSLSELLNTVTSVRGKFKVRVGMMHPKSVKNDVDELIRAFKSDKVYKFIHIPLQSGNDQVLSDMNRGHSAQEFLNIISQFRREIPEISISTDIIVGYPTEDEEAFQDTLKVIEEIQPDFLHISKYHHRPGSNSSSLQEIEHQDMKKRSKELNELKYAITLHNNEKLLGTVLPVLITDTGRKGGFTGRTDSYKLVVVDHAPLGSFVDVEITEAKATYLKGHVVSD